MDVRFPIFIDLTDNNCTIIGGGEYASACADMLLGFGAKVTVISAFGISRASSSAVIAPMPICALRQPIPNRSTLRCRWNANPAVFR